MKRLETPRILNDLYRDLRDRRLLIPVLALLVAIVAVPLLLANGEEPAPPPALAAMPEDATEVSAAVLAEKSGIRDYRERLSARKEQNPFEQKFAAPGPGAGGGGGAEANPSATGDTSSTETAPTAEVPPSDTSSPAPGAASSPSPAPVLTEPGVDVSGPITDADPPRPEIRFYAGRVDVSFGALGKKGREFDDVRELDLVPGDKNPIVAFTGLAGNGEHGVFSLSPRVVDSEGEGSCAPKKPDPCQFLRLGEGEVRYLKTESGKTYKLRLRNANIVRIADPREGGGSESGSDATE